MTYSRTEATGGTDTMLDPVKVEELSTFERTLSILKNLIVIITCVAILWCIITGYMAVQDVVNYFNEMESNFK